MLLQGTGNSYGVEFLLKKDLGRVNGWVAYTLSWADRQFDELNDGKKFWAKYDRRHVFTVVANVDVTKWFTVSAIWEYMSGARFTPLVGNYVVPDASLTNIELIPIYAERNSVRGSDSHRLDLNLVFRTKPDKKFVSEFFVGAYNVYNRATPYQITIVQAEDGSFKYQQNGLFGFLPSVAWNFYFLRGSWLAHKIPPDNGQQPTVSELILLTTKPLTILINSISNSIIKCSSIFFLQFLLYYLRWFPAFQSRSISTFPFLNPKWLFSHRLFPTSL